MLIVTTCGFFLIVALLLGLISLRAKGQLDRGIADHAAWKATLDVHALCGAASLAIIVTALMLALLPPPAHGAPRKPRERIEGIASAVGDGDAVRVALRWVRIARVDAPELAARNRAWPEQPGAIQARGALAGLVLGRRVRCVQIDESYGRPVSECTRDDGLDLSREMARQGWAWADPDNRGKPFLPVEAGARVAGLGLWAAPGAVPPWCWRRPHAKRCAGVVVEHGKDG